MRTRVCVSEYPCVCVCIFCEWNELKCDSHVHTCIDGRIVAIVVHAEEVLKLRKIWETNPTFKTNCVCTESIARAVLQTTKQTHLILTASWRIFFVSVVSAQMSSKKRKLDKQRVRTKWNINLCVLSYIYTHKDTLNDKLYYMNTWHIRFNYTHKNIC